MQTWGTKNKVMENRQEFADNGKRTELVPEIPVRGKQVTQTIPKDEGDFGTVPRDQGGKGNITKIKKIKRERSVKRTRFSRSFRFPNDKSQNISRKVSFRKERCNSMQKLDERKM